MQEKVFISMPVAELQSIIIDCVNSCLKYNSKLTVNHQKTDQLFSIEEAAAFLNLKKATLYTMVQRREIPVNKRGNRLYFSKEELIEWVKSGRKMTNFDLKSLANTTYRKTNKS